MRPHVRFHLLLLIQQLRRILEFFVFQQPVHQFVARVLLIFRAGQTDRAAAAFST